MHFLAFDPYADRVLAGELGVELVDDLDQLFRRSDYLAINCPLLPSTRFIVNAERLSLMKASACIINTARGPLVDQEALVEALRSKTIAGAALDVFRDEPTSADDPLFAFPPYPEGPNLLFAPHAICWTDQCFAGIGASCVEACMSVKDGKFPAHLVNPKVAAM